MSSGAGITLSTRPFFLSVPLRFRETHTPEAQFPAKPEHLRADLKRMIELEREGVRGDPEGEAKAWLDKLAETNRERRGYQRLAAKGCMTDKELNEDLVELEETRATVKRELETLEGRRELIERLEREKNALLENYATLAPEALESLEPEQLHRVYRMLRLRVFAGAGGGIEVNGVLGGTLPVCEPETTQLRR